MLTVRTRVKDYNSLLYTVGRSTIFVQQRRDSVDLICHRICASMGMFHWVSLCSNTLNSESLHTSYFFHFCSFTETSKEKKTKVDPKLVFPVKLWLLSWLPRERKRWNSKTGLPQSDDKEDWVQLGERKQPGSPEEVPARFMRNFFQSAFPTILGPGTGLT